VLSRRLILSGLGSASLAGCATTTANPFVPAELAARAEVPDMVRIRFWGDANAAEIGQFLAAEAPLIRARYHAAHHAGRPTSNILALSGGADDGAFGAGLLVGWSRHGSRPPFDAVTGISAGSLIAPFAFLGRDYDDELAAVFTAYGGGDIYRANPLAGVFGGPAIADNAPLAALIARFVNRPMLARIAAERRRARYLFVGTTNLHAQRPVYWDMGRIAQHSGEVALELFRKILLASAALPGIFPPVEIEVQADGKRFSEIHVDGGPTREVFLSPTTFRFRDLDARTGTRVTRRLWVVRNGKLAPEYEPTALSATSIGVRALSTLTKYQGIGDLNRIYAHARLDGMDFNLASIPADFDAPRPAAFDTGYMTALYETGVRLGAAGYRWAKAPPQSMVASPG
jgi:predicted acylesterase/phospholipase RssA